MIDRKQLLADLKPLLREMEADLRARCDEVARINADLTREYEQARAANRVGVTFEEWRADLITQVAAAWVLSSVFVRFLEDNALTLPPRISGPLHGAGDGQGLMRARDERDVFFSSHPTQTDRDYLLAVFDDLAKLPGMKNVFGPHNPVSAYREWLSGDAAQKLIEFFQRIDTDGTGEIVHDFSDPEWDTRFLGDLYQDLSETARKNYALLQTPIFVEEFILDRTLEPAIKEFGLRPPLPLGEGQGEGVFKMIDPTCGSGHFVLGGFARILNHWRKAEPGTNDRELVNRAIASVHGVDLNPYAVAIARFRLLIAAMRACHVTKLKDAPSFAFNLVCGDSLLHGTPGPEQQLLGFHELAHVYQSEDLRELQRVLKLGQYHAIVANPPYIVPKDDACNRAYRERYPSVCHRQYSLAAPFMQRLFDLGCKAAYVGQITANSFMKREFGKKLVEQYLPKVDLTHVIDTAGAYIPGHGTPTVILFGRSRRPMVDTVRAVMGIKGEPGTPQDASKGLVWSAILDQMDRSGSVSAFVSVADTSRSRFHQHPWSIGGGGISDLKMRLDGSCPDKLGDIATSIGFFQDTHADEAFVQPSDFPKRRQLRDAFRHQVRGDDVRDWGFVCLESICFPYDPELNQWKAIPRESTWAWFYALRSPLQSRSTFGGDTYKEAGRPWFDYHQFPKDRLSRRLAVVFPSVATHNHFALNDSECVFNRSAPLVRLRSDIDVDGHLGLLGLLNSSVACFWMKQVFHNKGSTVDEHGARQRTMPFEDFYDFDGTKLKQFPLAQLRPHRASKAMHEIARKAASVRPEVALQTASASRERLLAERTRSAELLGQMITLQEELDWECYQLYGLLHESPRCDTPPLIERGQRAFEIVMARKMVVGEEETTWFVRHGSTPITEIPAEWPEEYRRVVQRRIEIIENDHSIALIERPEYKRRWNVEPWEQQQEKALRNWLLDRLECYFDLDGRMNDQKTVTARGNLHGPRLTSVAKIADLAKQDKDFMQVAEPYTGRMDFDVANLVGDLVVAESVPCLPILRYKPTGLDKRAAWERTWDLQRLEDAVDAIFDVERLRKIEPGKVEEALRPLVAALRIDEQVKPQVLADAVGAASYVSEAAKQKLNLTSDLILKPVTDAAKRAKQRAVGDIPVPPKYTSADFLGSGFWRLRGKLDVPKERWVSFPYCEGEDGTPVIAWAGYDQLQLARAIAERYEQAKEHEGRKLVPLLACIGQLIPWLKQWHNDLDPAFGTRMGDYFEGYLAEEAKALGMTVAEVMAWIPPVRPARHGKRKRSQSEP